MKTMPKGVRAIGIFFEVLSFFPLLAGIGLLFSGGISIGILKSIYFAQNQNFTLVWPIGIILVLTAVLTFAVAHYLLRGKKWAWWALVILLILNGISQLGQFPRGLFSLVLVIGFIYYLTQENIRSHFN